MPKELEWGCTPWDDMTKEELLREVQRMYSAITSASSVLAIWANSQTSAYWGPEGVGGKASEKIRQVINHTESEYESEEIYRAFFRYADDLLFDCREVSLGAGWCVCPLCDRMFGRTIGGDRAEGKKCGSIGGNACVGVLRPIIWEDLAPKLETNERNDDATH